MRNELLSIKLESKKASQKNAMFCTNREVTPKQAFLGRVTKNLDLIHQKNPPKISKPRQYVSRVEVGRYSEVKTL